jgi:hypothetical protein
MDEVREYRKALIQHHGKCMLCEASPTNRVHSLPQLNVLCCHEILNGPLRDKVLDEPSCLIVACWYCNQYELDAKGDWPLSRQLSVIKQKAPERYDLRRVLELRNPQATNYVTEEEVDVWLK